MTRLAPSSALYCWLARAAWLCAWLLLATHVAATGATESARWSALTQTSFQHLRQDDGLPGEIATAVAQDGDGFLWVGSLSGLARWDGYRFRIYKAGPGHPGALPDNLIQVLHTDTAGRLWAGTSAAGLVRYERSTDQFISYPVGGAGLSHVSVNSIIDDGSGGLWVGTEAGLDHVDGSKAQIRHLLVQAGLPQGPVLSLLNTRDGSLWVGTEQGLFRRLARAPRFEPVALPASATQARPQSLFEDSRGQVWIGTAQHGAFVIERAGDAPRPVQESLPPGVDSALGIEPVVRIIEASPGEVWLGTLGQGIVAVDLASGRTRRIRQQPNLAVSLADNAVRGLFRDRSGLVWVASNRGLSRHDPSQTAVLTMYGAPACGASMLCGAQDGPGNTEVSWILPLASGHTWLGTHKRGVEIIDASGVLVAALRPDARHPDTALPPDIVLGLEQGGDGRIYIATKRGLYRADSDGRRVTRLQWPGRDPSAPTWALLADGERLWIGGQGDGLWRLDVRSGLAQPVLQGSPTPLSDQRIIVLARSAAGGLWVGTRNGLNHFDPLTAKVTRGVLDAAGNSSFITALYTDRTRRLWVGSYGGGIRLLSPDGNQRQLTVQEALPDNNVNALVEDAQGHVWVSTDNGLARIDPETLQVQALRRAEGVAFQTYWTGSAARNRDGDLLFGGAGGMTIVRASGLQPWNYRPPLVVSELRVGETARVAAAVLPHVMAEAAKPATAVEPSQALLQIPADANSLAVEYAALDFSAPERNRYEHRLVGFDRDWIGSDATRRLAAYNNLPPGRYELQLRGSNRDGLWTEATLSLPIEVLPAWHQTLWFRALAITAGLMLLALVVQLRTRLLRRRQRVLELKVQERTAALEEMSRALEEKSRVLELASISDPLTGLHNRRFLMEHIETELTASQRRAREAEQSGLPHPVDTDSLFFLIDIDHFKQVNDHYGHAAGDAVLVQFGRRLRSVLRESDHLVRWGGEEFLAVARDTNRERVQELAERLRSVVAEQPFVLEDGRILAVTCSIGFACMPFFEPSPRMLGWQEVVCLADLALLSAKRAGRNAWVGLCAGPAWHAGGTAEALMLHVQADLQRCVRQGELLVSSSKDAELVLAALRRVPAERAGAALAD